MNEASIPDEVTFPLIQPLIQSAAQRGTRLTCVFECPVSSKTASATVDILQANDNAFATKARARVTAAAAKSVSRSVGRTLRGLFGNNVVGKLAGEFANDKTKGLAAQHGFDNASLERAKLAAFEQVRRQFTWQPEPGRFVHASVAAGQ
ncbi:MAG: hypothetical protein KDE27_05045 [Planctomycetes bacterium]|nr:hypothetical protein [Planctomycetota bacterium]